MIFFRKEDWEEKLCGFIKFLYKVGEVLYIMRKSK